MIEKNINDISIEDIEALKTNSVSEGKTIEYKSQLPGNSDKDKIRFLANVSSFANTNGGDIIYGIKELDGKPASITGIKINNLDQEKLRLEQIIRNGIEPSIQNIQMHEIQMENDIYIFIIRILKSWNAPYRVTLSNHSKFYGRNSAGRYALDVSELKAAFLLTENITNRIRNFIAERITAINADNTPIPLDKGAKVIMHLIPLSSFTQRDLISIGDCLKHKEKLRPLGGCGWSSWINIDGLLTFEGNRDDSSSAYAQLYRSGIIETVYTIDLFHKETSFPSTLIERNILNAFESYLPIYKDLDFEIPLYIFISLLGIKGYIFGNELRNYMKHKINRDIIQLPELSIESFDVSVPTIFRPLFDMIWNAWGYERCYNYDNDGKRIR